MKSSFRMDYFPSITGFVIEDKNLPLPIDLSAHVILVLKELNQHSIAFDVKNVRGLFYGMMKKKKRARNKERFTELKKIRRVRMTKEGVMQVMLLMIIMMMTSLVMESK